MAPYPGRDGDYDLGRGHSCTWEVPGELAERHQYGPRGGWHTFAIPLNTGALAAGGPGAEGLLTIAVPLTCPLCGITGRITSGRWVPS